MVILEMIEIIILLGCIVRFCCFEVEIYVTLRW